ncbi:MAG: n-acetylglutamate synthase [Microscillaceae bacterium]|jgi:hypothetical protein|nr:n-acetylglutamate synthase [Microscillaceae bacterium]
MRIDYNHRIFKSVQNTPNGEVNGDTTFYYHQVNDRVWANYSGGGIEIGTLIAKVDAEDNLEMLYQHLNQNGEFMTGKCHSTPEILADGRIRLHEVWQWTSGDFSQGESIVEEVKNVTN